MRKLIAWVFMYSLGGLLADEGTDYWQYCFGLPIDPEDQKQKLGLYESAYAHRFESTVTTLFVDGAVMSGYAHYAMLTSATRGIRVGTRPRQPGVPGVPGGTPGKVRP